MPHREERRATLAALAGFFLRLGCTAFGGPAAHIALMEETAVRRRKWLSPGEFLDLVGVTSLIPGPGSTQLAMMIGYRVAGAAGLLLGGLCFIVPAAAITLGLAWAYVRFGRLPAAQGFLYGIKPVVLMVVVQAIISLGRSVVRSRPVLLIGLAALAAAMLDCPPMYVLAGAGVLSALPAAARNWSAGAPPVAPAFALLPAGVAGGGGLFLIFLKFGATVMGNGYVLFSFLNEELVLKRGWLSPTQLIDAVAVGQLTPGPVFTSATFIGYLLGGLPGAGAATAGVFLPSFFFIALLGPLARHLRRSPVAAGFLNGVNGAALALMAKVAWDLGRPAVTDGLAAGLALLSLGLLLRFRVNPVWLLLGAGLLGCLAR
jgi:chromate transporter